MDHEVRIKWLKGDAKGSVDVFPVNLFAHVTAGAVMAHVVEFSGGGADFARFTARVQPHGAILDYGLHKVFNIKRGMELGRLELKFTDSTRMYLKAVAWNGENVGPPKVVFGTVAIGKTIPAHLRPQGAKFVTGAGFGSPRQNARVEKAAMTIARAWLSGKGWTVRSVEAAKCGYDLECIRGKESLHVEVKGVQGGKVSFILTNAERKRAAEDPRFRLLVVTNALSKPPRLRRYTGQELEQRFTFSPLQWWVQ